MSEWVDLVDKVVCPIPKRLTFTFFNDKEDVCSGNIEDQIQGEAGGSEWIDDRSPFFEP